jgi:N utilization substance protein A
MNIEFIDALEEMAKAKGIVREDLYEAIRRGLAVAYKEQYYTEADVEVEIDQHSGDILINGKKIDLAKFGRQFDKKLP